MTLASLAALGFVGACVAHEIVGHGAACLALGGRVTQIAALDLRCQLDATASVRAVAAAGPVVALFIGLVALAVHRRCVGSARRARRSPAIAYFLWSLATCALLLNTGYPIYSAAANVGDWAIVFRGASPLAWRVPAIGVGLVMYLSSIRAVWRALWAMTGNAEPLQRRRSQRTARWVYAVVALLALVTGARQDAGASVLALSGLQAGLASVLGMAPLLLMLEGTVRVDAPVAALKRDWRWVADAVTTVALFVWKLGPGVYVR